MFAMQLMAMRVAEFMRSLRDEESGQGMIEYALLASLISIVAIATIKLIGPEIKTIFENIEKAL